MPADRVAVLVLSAALALAGTFALIATVAHKDRPVVVVTSAVRR